MSVARYSFAAVLADAVAARLEREGVTLAVGDTPLAWYQRHRAWDRSQRRELSHWAQGDIAERIAERNADGDGADCEVYA